MTTTYHSLAGGDFSQDWSNIGLITANDDWSGVPSIMGYLGEFTPDLTTGTDPRTVTASTPTVDVVANVAQLTANNGGALEMQINDPTIALQGSGTADAPYIVIHLDATGREDVEFSFRLRDLDTDTATQPVAVQYRIGNSGTWTNVPDAYVANINTGGTDTVLTGTLPAAADGQGELQVRVITTNAVGSDALVGIDDIFFTSSPSGAEPVPGTLSIADASVSEGDSGTQNLDFTVTRADGDDGAVAATWTITLPGGEGGADSGDLGTVTLTGTVSFANGQTSATISIPVQGDTVFEPDESFTVTLSDPTGGATLTDAVATGTILNDDTVEPVPGELAIADSEVIEGDSGAQNIVFTVTRSGGNDGAVSATWTATFSGGTNGANAGDFVPGTIFTGTVEFADGQTSATITLPVQGDVGIEPGEVFSVTLSDPTGGATLADGSATGTILDDDTPANVFINEFHYDNDGTDAGEAIEIAGAAGTSLAGWSLVLYNFTTGASYQTINLSGTIDNEGGSGFGALSFAATNIQNGPNDGIALVDAEGEVVQFLSYEGPITATNGPAAGLTSTDVGVAEEPAPAPGYSLQLTGSGSGPDDFTWALVNDDSFGSVNAGQTFLPPTGTSHVRVVDASVTEGDSGTSELVFLVRRAGGSANEVTVDYAIDFGGTADAGDLALGNVLSGTITFAPGETVKQVILQVQGDVAAEYNETLGITLSSPVGDVALDDSAGVGTIINDDPLELAIGEIQGAGHVSEFDGQVVITTGIVTAVDSNGFYIQSAVGDGNAATSDAIFVFTSTAPTVALGQELEVRGTVDEFQGDIAGLSVTQLVAPTIGLLTVDNDLPDAILIGTGGVLPPTDWIDDDGLTSFDPATDGIDFWETMEGMRVTLDAPLVVSNTSSFGETDVVVSGGAGATGVNDRGGITVSPGDFNPEKIQIDDDSAVFGGFNPAYSIGDTLSSVTGVLNYGFNAYEVIVTEAVTVTNNVTLGDDDTELQGDADNLSVATYNLENLDPTDPATKFEMLADDIVYSLLAPDIIAVQEIQDADGPGNGPDLSGAATAALLIQAIEDAGGPTYVYVEVAPSTAGSSGGEGGGNIRTGYLYNPDRVDYLEGSAERITGSPYDGSRKPLSATFEFNGEEVMLINVHFTSRIGSEPLWGDSQPPADAGDGSRTEQAAGVLAYINDQLATDPDLNIAMLGDFNGFYFEEAQTQLTSGGVLTHLQAALLPEAERYSYLFEGNAQLIDNILVTGGLLAGAQVDAVHLNSQVTGNRPTDHDPQVATFYLPANVAPVLGNPTSATVTLPADLLMAPLLQGVAVSDASFDGAGFTLTVDGANGAIYLIPDPAFMVSGESIIDTASGEAIGTITGLGSGSISVTDISAEASSALLSSLLQAFYWTPTGSTPPGTRTVTLEFSDGALSDSVTQSLDIPFNLVGGTSATEVLGGTGGFDVILGLDGNDRLRGFGGDDRLDGGIGADRMEGGAGNDRYIVDDAGDVVVEANGDGIDTVESSVGWSLAGQYIENLILTGSADINAVGNGLDNRLAGNAGVNALSGGLGNDTYVVDNVADRVIEKEGEGTDTIESSVTWSLAGQFVENLTLTGTAHINGTGNGLANVLTGNAGANVLTGGLGDDTYVVGAGDTVVERNGEGSDTIVSSGSWSLAGQYVENLTLTGTANLNGAGNTLGNAITGNDGNNILSGNAGNDVLVGGAGSDQLFGGTGNDTMTGGTGVDRFFLDTALDAATNVDTIVDFEAGRDRIALDATIFTALATGALAAGAFAASATAQDADDRILYDPATGALLYDADGTGGIAAVRFATLGTGLGLSAADFAVVP